MTKRISKRYLAIFTAVTLLIGIVPVSSFLTKEIEEVEASDVIQGNAIKQGAVSYDLSKGAYLLSGTYTVYDAEGTIVEIDGEQPTLTEPGDYTILTTANDITYSRFVSLYYIGDTNLNGTSWEEADLSLLQEMLNGVSIKYRADSAAEYAADIDNDEAVGAKDLQLMQEVFTGIGETSNSAERIVSKYHVPAETYDYLGGDEVMPIVGYYGPYYGPLENNKTYDFLTDEIYQLIKDCGINIINRGWNNVGDIYSDDYLLKALELGNKYGIGYYVLDYNLNPELSYSARLYEEEATNVEIGSSEAPTTADIAQYIGKYSYYENYFGSFVSDEPYINQWEGYDEEHGTGWKLNNSQLKYYDWTAHTMNQFANNVGYINSINPSIEWMYHTTTFRQGLDNLKDDTDAKMFSYTCYPFSGGYNLTDESEQTEIVIDGVGNAFEAWAYYYRGLWNARAASKEHDIPFWVYTGAGGDWRDSSSNAETNDAMLPTEAEVYWDVNHKLAFGAKGIEWFPLLQPWHFALEGDGYDADRNGLIGIDGTVTPFYEWAKNINQHIAAIDHVLMKSTSIGIIAIGDKTISKVTSGADTGDALISGTDMLQSISGGGEYGAIVGCFDYRDTEAFYVVNYSLDTAQTFELKFTDNYTYCLVQNAVESQGSGSTLTLSLEEGEGVLVVLEAEEDTCYTDEPNKSTEIVVTDVSGSANQVILNWGAADSIFGSVTSGALSLEAYSQQNAYVVYKNGTPIEAEITEIKTDSGWGISFNPGNNAVAEGDILRIGGVMYPTSGQQQGRLVSVRLHDYIWTNGTWNIQHNYQTHICSDCGVTEEGYYSVATYKADNASEAYPKKEGMLFAGWFTDVTCTTAYTESSGVAYAKFVDAGILTALAQIPIDVTYGTEKTKMRLVSTVDSEKYSQVGFIIHVEGSSKGPVTIETKNIFEKIVANAGGVSFTKTPTDINPNSKYFFTYTITNIPNARFYTNIYVTPYWITLDGTRVVGEKVAKTIDQGIKANAKEGLNVGGGVGGFQETPW